MKYIRLCPACGSERPVHEMYCQNVVDDAACSWLLMNVPQTPEGGKVVIESQPEEHQARYCTNGHEVNEHDFICMECGEDIDETYTTEEEQSLENIAEYSILEPIQTTRSTKECFLVEDSKNRQFFLTLYHEHCEPHQAIYDILAKADTDHIAKLVKTGVSNNRFFEVSELIQGGGLSGLDYLDTNRLELLVDEIGRALKALSDVGFRHRDICPTNILIRDEDQFDLVLIDYSSARLSDYDLDTDTPLEITRYTAPEAIIGAVSPASDWWSLGMIILEQLTQGDFFKDINDKAFMIQLIARGVQIPEHIDERFRNLLQGLLCRDPLKRWNWEQVEKWLNDEYVEPPMDNTLKTDQTNEKTIILGDKKHSSIGYFALAAAEEKNWEEGLNLFTSGKLSNWVNEVQDDGKLAAAIRALRSNESIDLEWRFSLALMHLNENLPLTWRGQVIISAWLLGNPSVATELIDGPIPDYLKLIEREKWLVNLKTRKENVLDRSKQSDILLDHDKLNINSLSTSRVRLKSELALLKQIYPDANHLSLSKIMGDSRLNEEDLILLLSAQKHQFITLEELIDEASNLALDTNLEVDKEFYREQLVKPRNEIYESLQDQLEGFSQCNNETLNRWADRFRVEKRLPLLQSILCLSIPKEEWLKPEKHDYTLNLLRYFNKKIEYATSRGPLVRLSISTRSSRIDLFELGTILKPAEVLISHIINRSSRMEDLDPLPFSKIPYLQLRMHRMAMIAEDMKRDTGLDTLYMGFPFIINQYKKTSRPKILPLILWPISISQSFIRRQNYGAIAFDKSRGEIRLNPALSGALEPELFNRIKHHFNELMKREQLTIAEVIDTFGSIITCKDYSVVAHPKITYMMDEIGVELHNSAALFNASFTGRAISEDLRTLQKLPHSGTAMEPILKITTPEAFEQEDQPITEKERFTTVDIDPSQERAVIQSRKHPGIVIEGPPGTGKSQTIVNIISECLGRKEKVLVVSQKRAALQVIIKRLKAVGLQNRAMLITDLAKDRSTVIRMVRNQISNSFNKKKLTEYFHSITMNRNEVANQIDRIESKLNNLSSSTHSLDPIAGLNYRTILSQLIELNSKQFFQVPELRRKFEQNSSDEINTMVNKLCLFIHDWLPAKYEGNSLSHLIITQNDQATEAAILSSLENFLNLETKRVQCIEDTVGTFDHIHIEEYDNWLKQYEEQISKVRNKEAKNIENWYELLYQEFNSTSIAQDILAELTHSSNELKQLLANYNQSSYIDFLSTKDNKELRTLTKACSHFLGKSFLKYLNPFAVFHQINVNKLCAALPLDKTTEHITELSKNLEYERKFRSLKQQASKHLPTLDKEIEDNIGPKRLAVKINLIINDLSDAIELTTIFKECPLKNEAKNILKSGEKKEYIDFIKHINDAILRYKSRQLSQDGLEQLKQWIKPSSYELFQNSINTNNLDISSSKQMVSDMKYFIPYQHFRIRLGNEKEENELLELLAIFRMYEDQLVAVSPETLNEHIRNTMKRECLLAWKQRIEKENPSLLMSENNIEEYISILDTQLEEAKELNKELLSSNFNFDDIGTKSEWNSITGLRGSNYKKLREFIKSGIELGLNEIRPVWLMSPDIVSQALPLEAGLFDVVIFDEASQMLVEHSVPALYRAKRVIISGDEKQMPPATFFGNKYYDEEQEELNYDDENYDDESDFYEEEWNKREIKDCPDLLTLAKTSLPTITLEIHYRSKYKSLINFSNYAFYSGQLHIPAQHSISEIEEVKPLEVLRLDGVYDSQTNEDEVDALIDYLFRYWQLPEDEVKSTGIVTFNKKQAELIEDKIGNLSQENEQFRALLSRERNRKQDGEEMGFFVKNVENVQGDERDIILFSTTFGPNKNGVFRRNFGALGHKGGERRLNVAITRARYKVVIATSMPLNDISDLLFTDKAPTTPRDYLQAYLNYSELNSSNQIEQANRSLKQLSHTQNKEASILEDDGFRITVKQYIEELGYEVEEGEKRDVFYLDLLVKDTTTGKFVMGIECDVPYSSLLQNARYRELWRPLVLKKTIPNIYRTSSYKWLSDTDSEKLKLKKAIEKALNK